MLKLGRKSIERDAHRLRVLLNSMPGPPSGLVDHTHSAPGDGGSLVIGTTDTDAIATHVFYAGVGGVFQAEAGFTYDDATDTITLAGGIILTGGANAVVTVNDNVANALTLIDAGPLEYLRIISTDAQPIVRFNDGGADIDFEIEAVGVADAFQVRGADGQITLGVLGAGFVQSTAGGVLFSAAIVAGDLPAHTHSGAGQGGSLIVGTTDTDATPGSVFFAGAAGVIQQDNANFFWDDGNNYLGIGTAAPNNFLCIGGAVPAPLAGVDATLAIVGGNTGRAFLEGAVQADTIWYDSGGIATFEAIQFVNGGGVSKFRILDDAPWGVSIDNVLVIDMDTGFIGAGTAVPDEIMHLYTGATAVDRTTLKIGNGGWAAPGALGVDSDGDKIIFYEAVGGKYVLGLEDGAIWFQSHNNFKFYRDVTLDMILNDGNLGVGAAVPNRRLHSELDDASTASVLYPLRITRTTSGSPGAGIGAGIEFEVEADAGNLVALALQGLWEDETANENAEFRLLLNYNGNLEQCGVIVGPDYNSINGNQRGVGAVDWQTYRDAAVQVASGAYATIIGGATNIASDTFCVAAGARAAAIEYGQLAFASGCFAVSGDAQWNMFILRSQETHNDNTWRDLYQDGAAQQMVIPIDTVWNFFCRIVGTTQGGGAAMDVAAYNIDGVIENDNGGVTILYQNTTEYVDEPVGADYQARANIDFATDALLIQVRDANSQNLTMRWAAVVSMIQVRYS